MEEQMEIKRFLADDIRSAMISVRETLGEDAVILSNRRKGEKIEILAAIELDPDAIMRDQSLRQATRQRVKVSNMKDTRSIDLRVQSALRREGGLKSSVYREEVLEPKAHQTEAGALSERDLSARLSALVAKGPAESATPRRQVDKDQSSCLSRDLPCRDASDEKAAAVFSPAGARVQSVPVMTRQVTGMSAVQAERLDALQIEFDALKRLLTSELSLPTGQPKVDQYSQNQVTNCMIGLGLSADLVERVMTQVDFTKTEAVVQSQSAQSQTRDILEQVIRETENDFIDGGGVVAVIGASGVGKTTTVAKLAARFAAKHGRESVALITTDAIKVGGQDQLLTFGKLLGIPVQLATDSEQLIAALRQCKDKKLVLIDSAGASLRDLKLNRELSRIKMLGGPVKNMLVVSATSQLGLSEQVARDYGHADIRAVVVTKIDEAVNLGSALAMLIRSKLPFAYSCNGQAMPDIAGAKIRSILTSGFAMMEKSENSSLLNDKEALIHA